MAKNDIFKSAFCTCQLVRNETKEENNNEKLILIPKKGGSVAKNNLKKHTIFLGFIILPGKFSARNPFFFAKKNQKKILAQFLKVHSVRAGRARIDFFF